MSAFVIFILSGALFLKALCFKSGISPVAANALYAFAVAAPIAVAFFARRHVRIERFLDFIKTFLAVPSIALLIQYCAFLPVEIPGNWNHFLARYGFFSLISAYAFFVLFFFFSLPKLAAHALMERPAPVFLLFLVPVFSLGLASHYHRGIDVDEPGYFLTAVSLARDCDLNVANNCDTRFVNDYLEKQGLTKDLSDTLAFIRYCRAIFHDYLYHKNGSWIVKFPVEPLMPLLWAPAYAFAGLPGIITIQCLCFALGLFALFHFSVDSLRWNRHKTLKVLFGVSLILPCNAFMARFFPETSAFVLIALFFWLSGRTGKSALIGWISLAFLPFIHIRFAFFAVLTAICHAFIHWRKTPLATVFGPLALLVISFCILIPLNKKLFLVPLPEPGQIVSRYGEKDISREHYIRSFDLDSILTHHTETSLGSAWTKWSGAAIRTPFALFRYILDGSNGMVIYAPLFIAALAFIMRLPLHVLVPCCLYLLFISFWQWHADEFAPSRYATAVAPIILLTLASRPLKPWLSVFLWLLSFIFSGYFFMDYGALRNAALQSAPWAMNVNQTSMTTGLVLVFWIACAYAVARFGTHQESA